MTEKEIIQKLEQFKEGLELFKSKLDTERETNKQLEQKIEELNNTNAGLDIENKYLKEQAVQLKNQNDSDNELQMQIDDLQIRIEDAEALADKKVKEAQDLRELAEKIERKNESLQADLKEKEENSNTQQLDDQIIDLENDKNVLQGLVTERDYTIKDLKEQLQKEKDKNKTLAEESMNYKTEIDSERSKLSKKIEDKKKALSDTQTLLDSKTAEYAALEKEYESLQISYKKSQDKIKELKEKASHSIVAMPADKIVNNNKIIFHYNLGPTSENVMEKFIQVIKRIYDSAVLKDGYFWLSSIEDAAKELDIGQSDTSVIKTRLLGMKAPDGTDLLIEDNGKLKSRLNCDSFVGWISKIKESK